MLERAGILTWCQRLVRVREACTDLFGWAGTRWRVLRTSNGYGSSIRKPRRHGLSLQSPIFRREPRLKGPFNSEVQHADF